MRILRLVDDGAFAVEFHPYITVVAGSSDEQRDRIARAFSEAALGRPSDLRGLIEVHGVVLDLDERALDLLELDDSEVQTSLFAEDLPGNTGSSVDRQVRAAEDRLEALEQPNRDRVGALQEAEAALEDALRAEEEPRAALDAATDEREAGESTADDSDTRSEAAEATRAALVGRRAELQAERDRWFASLDPGAAPAVAAAEEHLRTVAEASVESGAAADDADLEVGDPDDERHPPPPANPEERAALIEELRTSLSLHRLYDPVPVREALDDVRSAQGSGELVPSTAALSLADRLGDLDRRIAAAGVDGNEEPSPADLDAAHDRVERARLTLAELEREASTQAGTDDLAALEEAHAEVERARDALDGRFGRARAQKRLDEALAAEDEILERLGLHSYADYLARGGTAAPVAGSANGLDIARTEVTKAESELADLQAAVDAALGQARLVDERRQARDEARQLLDAPELPDESITTELLNVRVPADVSGPISRLADVLETVGLPVGDLDLRAEELEEMVADWLAEYQHTESRLLRRIEHIESLDAPGAAAEVPVIDAGAPTSTDDDRIADAQAEVDVARARLAAHEEASRAVAEAEEELATVESELDELAAEAAPAVDGGTDPDDEENDEVEASTEVAAEAALTAASDAVTAARDAVEAASAALDATQTDYDSAVEELAVLRQTMTELDHEPPPVGEIEWYLLARLAAQRQQSFVGSLPLVIAGALDDVTDDEGLVHLLDRLERMAGAVQIVHLTDDPRIIEWAQQLDDERAAVVRPVAAKAETG